MPKLSYNQRRMIVAVALVFLLLSEANQYWKLHWFGDYGRAAEGVAIAFLFITVLYIGPTISEMRERRAQKDRALGQDK
jgi:hypothetical protein